MTDVVIDMTQVEENNDQDFVRTHMRYICMVLFLFATTAGISTFAFDVYEGHRAGMEVVFALTFVDVTIPTMLEACGVITLPCATLMFFIVAHLNCYMVFYLVRGMFSTYVMNLAISVWGLLVGMDKFPIMCSLVSSFVFYASLRILEVNNVEIYILSDYITKLDYTERAPYLYLMFEGGLKLTACFLIILEAQCMLEHTAAETEKTILMERERDRRVNEYKLQELELERQLQIAKKNDDLVKAYAAMNHNGKRVLNETVFWMQKIESDIAPVMENQSGALKAACTKLVKIARETKSRCRRASKNCREVLMREAIGNNTYEPFQVVTCMRSHLELYCDAYIGVVVDSLVPQWILLDQGVFDIVAQNAISNAKVHGEKESIVHISCRVDSGRIVLTIRNKPGANHTKAQRIMPTNCIECASVFKTSHLGNVDSTFLGLNEITGAVRYLTAGEVSLEFNEYEVVFTLSFEMVEVAPMGMHPTTMPLPNGTALICIDDDKCTRLQYKGLIRKLELDPEKCLVLGETFDEVKRAPEIVMRHANRYNNVIVITDQNFDEYEPGQEALGTDILEELTAKGFSGLMFVRSGNDSVDDIQFYRKKGACDVLSKESKVADLAVSVLLKHNEAMVNN